MKSTSIKLRAFNIGGAFEIKLPNDKVVLIDPCFRYYRPDKSYTDVFEGGFTKEDVTGADYIILSHSHWDHDLDIGYFVEKFNSKVFCSITCAEEIAKYHNITYDNLFPVWPNSVYTLEDLTLKTFQSKHNPMGSVKWEEDSVYTNKGMFANKVGVSDHGRLDQLGSIDSMDFLLTTNTNFSILMASGRIVWTDIFDTCKKERPNVLLRQAGFRRNGDQVPPAELAEIFKKYGAQIIFPFHHEVLVNKMGMEWTEAYFEEVAKYIAETEPGMAFIYPKAWCWYDIGIDVSPCQS